MDTQPSVPTRCTSLRGWATAAAALGDTTGVGAAEADPPSRRAPTIEVPRVPAAPARNVRRDGRWLLVTVHSGWTGAGQELGGRWTVAAVMASSGPIRRRS